MNVYSVTTEPVGISPSSLVNVNSNCVDVPVTDIMLTPLSCAHIVNEIIKCLIYQKEQIPYPYNWLKTLINRKRSKEQEDNGIKNFTVSSHYKQASITYDILNELMNEVIKEFTTDSASIEQVTVVFGTVAQCPQQVYHINIPELTKNHVDKIHINEALRNQHKILRPIFLSDAWMDSMDMKLNTVNTFVFLKKKEPHTAKENNFFIPCRSQQFDRVNKQVTININYENDNYLDTKCCNFEVFSETGARNRTEIKDCVTSLSSENTVWLGSKSPLKGFKDSFINKVSVSELW